MTVETQTKNRGGRIRAPLNAAECREAIARETMFAGRETRIRRLFRLLKAFVDSDKAAREDRRIAAIAEQNRIREAELELRKMDYRLRFAKSALGIQALLKENERLKAHVAELEAALERKGGDHETKL